MWPSSGKALGHQTAPLCETPVCISSTRGWQHWGELRLHIVSNTFALPRWYSSSQSQFSFWWWLFLGTRWSTGQVTPSWCQRQLEPWGGYSRFQFLTLLSSTDNLTIIPVNTFHRWITHRPVTYVWANATDTVSSHIKIYSVQVK